MAIFLTEMILLDYLKTINVTTFITFSVELEYDGNIHNTDA